MLETAIKLLMDFIAIELLVGAAVFIPVFVFGFVRFVYRESRR